MKTDTIDLDKIREKIELIPYPGFSRSIAHFKIFDFVEIRDGKLFVSLNVNMRSKDSYLTLKGDVEKVLKSLSNKIEYDLTINNEASFLDADVSAYSRGQNAGRMECQNFHCKGELGSTYLRYKIQRGGFREENMQGRRRTRDL